MLDELAIQFRRLFHVPPTVVASAPGRVNLIGEHTDYNEGFVLPMAIQQRTRVAVAPREDQVLRVNSLALADQRLWRLGEWDKQAQPHWTSYIAGVAELLRTRGAWLSGADLLIDSDLPAGSGLSSSAALEVATVLALAQLSGEPLESRELIDLCRQAEIQYAETPCGLMDQTASLLGQEGHALLIDCRTRQARPVPMILPDQLVITVDTGVRHELSAGQYAQRRQECAAAVAYFQKLNPSVTALRDVSLQTLRAHLSQMDPLAAARAMHVLSENQRTLQAAETLRTTDVRELGRRMYESHRSLRDDFEVSCRELDQVVEILRPVRGVHGARMTGGGFGGCVVALLERDALERVREALKREYHGDLPRAGEIVACLPSSGAALEPLPA